MQACQGRKSPPVGVPPGVTLNKILYSEFMVTQCKQKPQLFMLVTINTCYENDQFLSTVISNISDITLK